MAKAQNTPCDHLAKANQNIQGNTDGCEVGETRILFIN
jgi:hypothetical protein